MKEEIKKDDRVALWLKLNPDLRNQFKAWCAKRGKTMTQVLLKFVKTTVTPKTK